MVAILLSFFHINTVAKIATRSSSTTVLKTPGCDEMHRRDARCCSLRNSASCFIHC